MTTMPPRRWLSSITAKNQKPVTSCKPVKASLEEARTWIGRPLVLSKPLLAFKPGTACTVMCVVDFGDGLLLWIVTDDAHSLDIDQMELPRIEEYFTLAHSGSMERAG